MATATSVKERPIIFNGEMVRAILNGTKTQTRRIAALNETLMEPRYKGDSWKQLADTARKAALSISPFQVGMRLWVRETFNALIDPGAPSREVKRKVWNSKEQETEYWVVDYQADGPHTRIMDQTGDRRWQPSIHMPRWASRITLEITDVRVQRLQDISEADAKAEGVPQRAIDTRPGHYNREMFQELWHTIHAADGPNGWDASPWVWALTFKRINGQSSRDNWNRRRK